MPLYTFELSTTLEASQMEKLAQEITEWHAQAFTIPRMAISCQFQDVSGNYGFAGGKRQTYNRLYIHQRTATQSVPAEQLEAHAQNVLRLWDEIISGACMSSPAERAASPKALHGVYIVSSISLAYEYGVFLPMTGTYTDWVVKNEGMIRGLAGKDIPEFQGIVLEMDVEGKYGFAKRLQ